MAQEQFGFGVTEVSLKGAGKLYEVLARNEGQKAAVAGADASTAFGQYAKGMQDFNRYFAASQNTTQAAAQTESRANEALNAGRASLTRIGQRTLQENIRKANDVVTNVNTLFKAGQSFVSTLQRSQLQEGMVDGMRKAGEIATIQDPDEKKGAIEEFLTEYQKNPDNAYNQGMSRSIFPLYAGAVQEADVKRRETGIRSMLNMADNSYIQSGDKLQFNMPELQKFAKNNNLSMGEFRDALYSTVGGTVAKAISSSTDFNMLNELTEKWGKIKSINFDNEFVLKSKNLKTQELIGKTDRTINLAVTQAKSKIKAQAQTDWTKIMDNPKVATADQVEYTLQNMQMNPLEKDSKSKAFSEKYAEQAIDEEFRTTFTTTDASPYWDHLPANTKKAAEYKIGQDGAQAFLFRQPERLKEILQANPGHVKEIGTEIGKIFRNGTGQERDAIYKSLLLVRESSDASQALSQTMDDGLLAEMLTVGALAKSMGGSTQEQVNDNWDKASQMVANKTGSVPYKLSPNTDRDLLDNLNKDSMKMGENAGRFVQTIQTLFSKNPDVANERYDDLKEYYMNLSDTNTYSTANDSFDVTENFAHAPDPFKNPKTGLPEAEAEEAKATLLEQAKVNFETEFGYTPEFSSITYVGNDIVSIKDGWTNEVMTVPVRKFIDAKRDEVFEKQQLKAVREKETFKNVSSITLEEALNNVVNDAADFVKYLSDIEITRSK